MKRMLLVFLGAQLGVLLAPGVSLAGSILDIDCINSRAIYGTRAQHIMTSFCSFEVDEDEPADWWVEAGWFHTGSTLEELTLDTDAGGAVVGSHYRYSGGELFLEFSLENHITGERLFGTGVMPIVSLDVFSQEGTIGFGSVQFFATLGAGMLDESVANALGIGRRLIGGTLSDPFLGRRDGSSYTDDYREASEGGPTVHVQVLNRRC